MFNVFFLNSVTYDWDDPLIIKDHQVFSWFIWNQPIHQSFKVYLLKYVTTKTNISSGSQLMCITYGKGATSQTTLNHTIHLSAYKSLYGTAHYNIAGKY